MRNLLPDKRISFRAGKVGRMLVGNDFNWFRFRFKVCRFDRPVIDEGNSVNEFSDRLRSSNFLRKEEAG